MTDRARELLELALNFFEEICDSRSVGIEKSINAYLAEPEQDEEPVAWTNQDELNDLGPYINCYMYLVPEAGDIPLYLHPAPRPEFVRLSEEEIFQKLIEVDPLTKRLPPGFKMFARAIEDALEEKNK